MEDSTQYVFGSSAEDGWVAEGFTVTNDNLAEGFTVTNDNLAEWALVKIKEARADANRYAMVCKNMISEYEHKMAARLDKMKNDTRHLESLLEQYSLTVAMKTTKTQATYTLPSGKLKRKFGTVEFVRDDKVLVDFLKANHYTDYLEPTYKLLWAELKKDVTVSGNLVINESGEVIEGVTAVEHPDTFVVELEA